ncbi:MAG: hypothetical protein AAGF55_01090 [Pseudomonadota bacterium]
MSDKHIIILHETVLQSWLRDASTLALFVALIGIGVFLESAAMQWVGAFIGFTFIIGKAIASAQRDKMLSVSEARKKLDEIERGQ